MNFAMTIESSTRMNQKQRWLYGDLDHLGVLLFLLFQGSCQWDYSDEKTHERSRRNSSSLSRESISVHSLHGVKTLPDTVMAIENSYSANFREPHQRPSRSTIASKTLSNKMAFMRLRKRQREAERGREKQWDAKKGNKRQREATSGKERQ